MRRAGSSSSLTTAARDEMPQRPSKRELQLAREEEGFRGRSATYRYVRLNLQRFTAMGVGTQDGPTWEAFAARLTREHQTNRQGGPLGADSARRIFKRARRDDQAEQAAKAGAKQQRDAQPSRLPATWKPTPVEPTPVRAMPRPMPLTNTDSAPAAPIELSEAARATLAVLDRQLDWRDRHVNPPKRKD